MNKRSVVIFLIVLLIAVAGWYLYWRERERLDLYQHTQLRAQGAVENLAVQYTAGVFGGPAGAGKITVQLPTEIQTGSGTSIVYDDRVFTVTAKTQIQRFDSATYAYIPAQLSDFTAGARIVIDAAPDGTLNILYLIQ